MKRKDIVRVAGGLILLLFSSTLVSHASSFQSTSVPVANIPTATSFHMPIGSRSITPSVGIQRGLYFGFTTTLFPGQFQPFLSSNCSVQSNTVLDGWYVFVGFNTDTAFNGSPYIDFNKDGQPDFHPGEDWNGQNTVYGDQCQPVYPIAEGVVIGKGWISGFGYMLFIVHKLANGELILSVFAHLNELPTATLGSQVDPSTPLARIGRTGGTGYKPHLHWEIRKSSFLLDDGTNVSLKADPQFRPGTWPATGSTDNGMSFITANYLGPSDFLKSQSAVPTLSISTATCPQGTSCSGPQGTTFNFDGTGFTPDGTVRRFIEDSAGTQTELTPVSSADSSGQLSWSFTSTCATPVGTFLVFAVDSTTDTNSNKVTETITAGNCPIPLAISTTSLPDGAVGTFYSSQFQATGGTTPYTWSISSGNLPPGLLLDATSGIISGTPFSGGAYPFTVRVTDSSSLPQTATRDLAITILASMPVTIATSWDGSWFPDTKTCAPPPYPPQELKIELLQTGERITGTLSGPGILPGTILGTLIQGTVDATLDYGVQPPDGTLVGTISGDHFTGFIEEFPRSGFCTWTGPFDLTLSSQSTLDGGFITFRSNRTGGQFDIFLYDLGGHTLVPLPGLNDPAAFEELASPSADGRYIAFNSSRSGFVDIFLYDRQTSSLVSLPGLNDPTADDRNPALSPDGRFILFRSDRSGGQFDIFLYDRQASAFVNLPGLNDPSAFEKDYQMTADGNFIVFASDRFGTQYDVFLYDTASQSLISLPGLNDASADDDQPSIDDSARFVAFRSARRPFESIVLIYDRQTASLIDPQGVNTSPASNNFPWLSADGNFLVFDKTSSGSRDVFLYDRTRASFVPLPVMNDPSVEDSFARVVIGAPPSTTFDITGTWQGTWTSITSVGGSLTASLTQSGTLLSGTVSVTGSSCFTTGTVSGSISGNTVLIGSVFSGGQQASYNGTVAAGGTLMNGTYTVTGGLCDGDSGSWILSKTN